jgi:hypothetical protein
MISKVLDNSPYNFDNFDEFNYLSKVVIPFSQFFIQKEPDIYSGNENIRFKERDPEFKKIMLKEFTK